jgi:thiamine biosynthesis lipoprotein
MPTLTRRRFLSLSAIAALPLSFPARAAQITQWHGTALGAEAAIYLDHPDAAAIIARAVAEIARLEDIFSLTRAGSALSQLNAVGRLTAPPFELLECLALCVRVHAATRGLFDPTVQPLWQLYAIRFSGGQAPDPAQIAALLPRVGLPRVSYDSTSIRMSAGMALTLNGVAQGFIADKLAEMLAAEGLTDILINTGEFRALGQMPGGQGWPVKLVSGGQVALKARALATSAPLGTVFDAKGKVGHILNPTTGLPADALWSSVSISAPLAALADALTTAACLMPDRATIQAALTHFPQTQIEALV